MLTTEDRLAIADVIARYNRLADDRDVEGTVALYADDGRIDGDFNTGPGADGLRADLPGIFALEGTLKRHITTNHIIEGDGTQATVRSILVVCEAKVCPASARPPTSPMSCARSTASGRSRATTSRSTPRCATP